MFRNAKIGDEVWDFIYGWGKITDIRENFTYPFKVEFNNFCGVYEYTFEGKICEDEPQRLFWDEIKFEVPKKPFDLKEVLKENLKPKEFEYFEDNYRIYYSYSDNEFKWGINSIAEETNVYFSECNIYSIIDVLNDKKITMKEFKKALRELGWL